MVPHPDPHEVFEPVLSHLFLKLATTMIKHIVDEVCKSRGSYIYTRLGMCLTHIFPSLRSKPIANHLPLWKRIIDVLSSILPD